MASAIFNQVTLPIFHCNFTLLETNLKKHTLLKIATAALLVSTALTAQAQRSGAPDWSLILNGFNIEVIQTPPPAQAAPVRTAPVVVAPPVVQGPRHDDGWERQARERDHQFQQRFQERFQERENYWLERERAFLAREKAFLEREKQRQLVIENNKKASEVINDRQERHLNSIVDGVAKGTISKDEFLALMAQQRQISKQEREFLADGFLSEAEFKQLNDALEQAKRSILSEKGDGSGRQLPRDPRERIYFPQNR